jgi:hypothetical protein
MSISVNLHTKTAEKFEVKAYLTSNTYSDGKYPVIQVGAAPKGSWDYQEVYMFPSFEQVKQLHKELSKLMKEMAALEKRTKAEIHEKSIINSKAQKFTQMVLSEKEIF